MSGETASQLDGPRASGQQLLAYLDQEGLPLNTPLATFSRLLADRIGENTTPEGYVTASWYLLFDCRMGGDSGFTLEDMPRDVIGLSLRQYATLGTCVREWGSQAFGDEFGAHIEQLYREADGR
jgi:hypothetical protein